MSRPTARESVALMAGYHSPQIDVDVRLNTNESPEPPPEGFADAVAARVAEIAWHRYPQRSASELRSLIGANYGLSASQVFAANGSNEVLQTLLLTFAGPGRSAAVFEPTYALHSHLSRITGTAVIEGERNDDFSLDLDEVERVIVEHRPDVVFLCSPNNPTGVVDPEASIRRVLELTAANGGLLCVDEAWQCHCKSQDILDTWNEKANNIEKEVEQLSRLTGDSTFMLLVTCGYHVDPAQTP